MLSVALFDVPAHAHVRCEIVTDSGIDMDAFARLRARSDLVPHVHQKTIPRPPDPDNPPPRQKGIVRKNSRARDLEQIAESKDPKLQVEKVCGKCGDSLPLWCFNKDNTSSKDGRQGMCRQCNRAYMREYNQRRREEQAARRIEKSFAYNFQDDFNTS